MIEIVKYKAMEQKKENQALKAYIDIEWADGHSVRDASYFVKGNERWVNYPSRTYEQDGKTKYYSYIFFRDPDKQKAFQINLLSAIDKYLAKSQVNEDIPF